MSCTDGRTGYIDDTQVPPSFSVKVFEPYGDNMKGGTFKIVKIQNDKKFTIKNFLSESEEVQAWLNEKKIFTNASPSSFVLNLSDNTEVYESADGNTKVEKPASDLKYKCFWKDTPILTQAKCQNSKPTCSGTAQCTTPDGSTPIVQVSCLERTAGSNCKSASACALADDSLEIAISACRPKYQEAGKIGDDVLTNPLIREKKEKSTGR